MRNLTLFLRSVSPRKSIPSSLALNPTPATAAYPEPSDAALLHRYVHEHCQEPFAQIVNRHYSWVYRVCRRGLHDAHLAEDATQAVFLLLARKASRLAPETHVAGWLFQATRYVLADLRKNQARYLRRQRLGQEIAVRRQLDADHLETRPDAHLSVMLDDAVAALRESDRQILLMRFFEDLPVPEIATRLGLTHECAKKRLTRSLTHLRRAILAQSPATAAHTLSTAAILVLLRGSLSEAAPAALAATVVKGATTAGASSALAEMIAAGVRQASIQATNKLIAALATGAAPLVVWFAVSQPLLPGSSPAQSPAPAASTPHRTLAANVSPSMGAWAGVPASPQWPQPVRAPQHAGERLIPPPNSTPPRREDLSPRPPFPAPAAPAVAAKDTEPPAMPLPLPKATPRTPQAPAPSFVRASGPERPFPAVAPSLPTAPPEDTARSGHEQTASPSKPAGRDPQVALPEPAPSPLSPPQQLPPTNPRRIPPAPATPAPSDPPLSTPAAEPPRQPASADRPMPRQPQPLPRQPQSTPSQEPTPRAYHVSPPRQESFPRAQLPPMLPPVAPTLPPQAAQQHGHDRHENPAHETPALEFPPALPDLPLGARPERDGPPGQPADKPATPRFQHQGEEPARPEWKNSQIPAQHAELPPALPADMTPAPARHSAHANAGNRTDHINQSEEKAPASWPAVRFRELLLAEGNDAELAIDPLAPVQPPVSPRAIDHGKPTPRLLDVDHEDRGHTRGGALRSQGALSLASAPAVPEPSSVLSLVLVGLIALRRRRS